MVLCVRDGMHAALAMYVLHVVHKDTANFQIKLVLNG